MKFFSLLTLAAAVSATPVPGLELSVEQPKELTVRQTNLAKLVADTVSSTSGVVGSSLSAINTTITAAGNNVNVAIQAIVEANLNAIAQALTTGAGAINGGITAAGGDIAAAVADYGRTQIDQLLTAISQLVALLNNLSAQVTVIITGLNGVAPAVLKTLDDESAAIIAALNPFVEPIGQIVNAAQGISFFASVALSGFSSLLPGALAAAETALAKL